MEPPNKGLLLLFSFWTGLIKSNVNKKNITVNIEKHCTNRPRAIYQYSNMAPRHSGQTPIFGVAFFLSKSLLGIKGQKKLEEFAILTRKPRSHG